VPDALLEGWQLAAGFNPLLSLVASVVAAMLLARRPGLVRAAIAYAVLAGFWLIGDGIVLVQQAREALAAGSADTLFWVTLSVWALFGFGLGYALPTWAGTYVGRRVTFGTGWASAGVVAASVSGLVSVIVKRLGG